MGVSVGRTVVQARVQYGLCGVALALVGFKLHHRLDRFEVHVAQFLCSSLINYNYMT